MVEKVQIFAPKYGSGVTVASVTTTSASSSLRTNDTGNGQVVVTNTGIVPLYVRTGDSSVVATTADYLVVPNYGQIVLTMKATDTHIAYITESSTSSLHAIIGDGV
jgi:hypothetical protein